MGIGEDLMSSSRIMHERSTVKDFRHRYIVEPIFFRGTPRAVNDNSP